MDEEWHTNNFRNPQVEQNHSHDGHSKIDDPHFHSMFVLQNRFDIPKYYSVEVPLGNPFYSVGILKENRGKTLVIRRRYVRSRVGEIMRKGIVKREEEIILPATLRAEARRNLEYRASRRGWE